MKNRKSILLTVPMLFTFTLIGCGGNTPTPEPEPTPTVKVLESITATPKQSSYKINQSISKSDITVKAKYKDISTTYTVKNYTCTEFGKETSYKFTQDDVTAGSKTFNFSYTEGDVTATTSFKVTVKDLTPGEIDEKDWKAALDQVYKLNDETNFTAEKENGETKKVYKIKGKNNEFTDKKGSHWLDSYFHGVYLRYEFSEDEIANIYKSENDYLICFEDVYKGLYENFSSSKFVEPKEGETFGHYEGKGKYINDYEFTYKITFNKDNQIEEIKIDDEVEEIISSKGTYKFSDYGKTEIVKTPETEFVCDAEKDSENKKLVKSFSELNKGKYYIGVNMKNATGYDESDILNVEFKSEVGTLVSTNTVDIFCNGERLIKDLYYSIDSSTDLIKFNKPNLKIKDDMDLVFEFDNSIKKSETYKFVFDYSNKFNGQLSQEEISDALGYILDPIVENRSMKIVEKDSLFNKQLLLNCDTSVQSSNSGSTLVIKYEDGYNCYFRLDENKDAQFATNKSGVDEFVGYLRAYMEDPRDLVYDSTTQSMKHISGSSTHTLKFNSSYRLVESSWDTGNGEDYITTFTYTYDVETFNSPILNNLFYANFYEEGFIYIFEFSMDNYGKVFCGVSLDESYEEHEIINYEISLYKDGKQIPFDDTILIDVFANGKELSKENDYTISNNAISFKDYPALLKQGYKSIVISFWNQGEQIKDAVFSCKMITQ